MGKPGWNKSKVLAEGAVPELQPSPDRPNSTACAGNWRVNLAQSGILSVTTWTMVPVSDCIILDSYTLHLHIEVIPRSPSRVYGFSHSDIHSDHTIAYQASPNPGRLSIAHKMALRGEPKTSRSGCPARSSTRAWLHCHSSAGSAISFVPQQEKGPIGYINHPSCAKFYMKRFAAEQSLCCKKKSLEVHCQVL